MRVSVWCRPYATWADPYTHNRHHDLEKQMTDDISASTNCPSGSIQLFSFSAVSLIKGILHVTLEGTTVVIY